MVRRNSIPVRCGCRDLRCRARNSGQIELRSLRFDARRNLRNAVAGVGFWLVVAAANLALSEREPALASLLVGAVFAVLFLQPLLPGIYDLRLNRDGFMWRGRLGQTRHFDWNDVAHFRPVGHKLADVGFDLVHVRQVGWSARVSAGIVGAHHNLPDTYGLSAVELAALMNAWREHHHVHDAST
jgi:hypothetical protein